MTISSSLEQIIDELQSGDLARGIEHLQVFCNENPEHEIGRANLGLAYLHSGLYEKASEEYSWLCEHFKSNTSYLYHWGFALEQLGSDIRAETLYREVLRLDPSHVKSVINLSLVCKRTQSAEEALKVIESALGRGISDVLLLSNYIGLLNDAGRFKKAYSVGVELLKTAPDDLNVVNNVATTLIGLRDFSAALHLIDPELARGSNRIDLWYHSAIALRGINHFGEVARRLVKVASMNLDYSLTLGYLVDARRQTCDWSNYQKLLDLLLDKIDQNQNVVDPFAFMAITQDPAKLKRVAELYCLEFYPPQAPLWNGERYAHDRIRIAYLSADYHEHATAYLMAEFFEEHDANQFETYAISYGKPSDGAMRQRLVGAFDHFVDVQDKTDLEIAEMMRELEIDIAVDLKGYTAEARPGILAYRPCPIQAQYLGFPGTMGAPYIDYIIADDVIIPESHEQYYTEKVIRLPGCYQPYDSKQKISDRIPTRAEEGLPENAYVYCCFNNNYKITPEVFDVWMQILREVPDSVLWLYEGNSEAVLNLRKEAEVRGVDPSRLIFAKKKPIDEHLARHKLADLFLDTFPCNAHTTARDALQAGLPVLTMMGDTFASRVAASIGQEYESGVTVVANLDEYLAKATLSSFQSSPLERGIKKRPLAQDICRQFISLMA